MRLIQMTKSGINPVTYWLESESQEDSLQLECFKRDVMIDDIHTKKIAVTCITTGITTVDGNTDRLQLEIL